MSEGPPPAPRPPVLLGCSVAVGVLLLLVVAIVLGVQFLASGSDSGKVTLETTDSYAPGTATRVPGHGFFLVRLPGGEFIALSDLDAANRSQAGRRCRVDFVASFDPKLPALLAATRARISPEAAGSALLLREDCSGHLYDLAGIRLDGEGRNLDRHPVTVDPQGRLVVDTSKRTCSARGAVFAEPLVC